MTIIPHALSSHDSFEMCHSRVGAPGAVGAGVPGAASTGVPQAGQAAWLGGRDVPQVGQARSTAMSYIPHLLQWTQG